MNFKIKKIVSFLLIVAMVTLSTMVHFASVDLESSVNAEVEVSEQFENESESKEANAELESTEETGDETCENANEEIETETETETEIENEAETEITTKDETNDESETDTTSDKNAQESEENLIASRSEIFDVVVEEDEIVIASNSVVVEDEDLFSSESYSFGLGYNEIKYEAPKAKGSIKKLFGAAPSSYDARTITNSSGLSIVPPIRDQGSYGTCWAFSTLGMVETSIRKKDLVSNDADSNLSELALSYFTYNLKNVTNSSNIDKPGLSGNDYQILNKKYYENIGEPDSAIFSQSGGSQFDATMISSSYMGAIMENTDTGYNEVSTVEKNGLDGKYAFNNNDFELNDVLYINKDNRDVIKQAIMDNGSVGVSYFADVKHPNRVAHKYGDEWYYYTGTDDANHAILIVGWDDNISKDRFCSEVNEKRASNNGGWLCRNSWGDYSTSNGGYFWLSYDEPSIYRTLYSIDAIPADTYKYNYHYDTTGGGYYDRVALTAKFANIFKVSDDCNQMLEAVNVAINSTNAKYKILVYTSDSKMTSPIQGEKKIEQTVSKITAGIYTTKLDKRVFLKKGSYFSIIVEPISADTGEFSIFIDYTDVDINENAFYYNEIAKGQSYSFETGKWEDCYNNNSYTQIIDGKSYGMNYRIKALTNPVVAIVFNGNGSSNSMDAQIVDSGDTVKINKNTLVRSGYKFIGWEDEKGNSYDDGAEIKVTDSITLIAKWQAEPTSNNSNNTSNNTNNSTNTVSSGGSGRSGGSGGGGGGGGGGGRGSSTKATTNANNQPTSNQSVTSMQKEMSVSNTFNSLSTTWSIDPVTGKWKMNAVDINGQAVNAANGFYQVNKIEIQLFNTIPIVSQVSDTYCFDEQGNMVTGWVQTSDSKWYYFEVEKTADEGKMLLGWRSISDSWYYFNPDGSMLENGVTPDGHTVGADGKFIN